MSSRALKKKLESKPNHIENDDFSQESSDEETLTTKSTFSMLDLDDDEEDEQVQLQSNDDDDDGDEQEKYQKPSTNNNNKKKKSGSKTTTTTTSNSKKNKKNKNKNSSNNKSSDIDALVKNINSTTTTKSETVDPKLIEFQNLFKITSTNFNPDNELKKLLGCKLSDIKSTEKKKPINTHNHPNFKKKNYLFVTPKGDWPLYMSSMVMEVDKSPENDDGIQYFKMRWGQSYRDLQEEFYSLLESHNPMSIAALLRVNSYHIDSLLQLSQVCLQTADYQNAGEFVERSVFAFEIAWNHLFNPLSMNNSRFEYKHDENKSCFLSVFRYIQILGRRGCPGTALEFCKLLLLFDYKDPLFVRLIIDFYAIQSKSYKFLLDLYHKIGKITPTSTQSLDLLPNFCYSVALATFLQENENQSSSGKKDHKKSNELLQKALLSFPSLLKPLIEKLKTSLVILEGSKSKNLVEDPFFCNSKDNSGIDHLITLFVERNHSLWQSPNIIEWIKENTLEVIERIKKSPEIVNQYQEPVRKEYSTMNSEIFDHLVLSEYSDVIQRLPPDLIEMMRREGYDNIAPQQLDPQQIQQQQQQQRRGGIGGGYQIYQQQMHQQQRRQLQQLQQQQQQQLLEQEQIQNLILQNHNQPILHDAVPHNPNPLIDFIQTLLPWNDPTQQLARQQQQANANNGQGFLDPYIEYDDEDEPNDE